MSRLEFNRSTRRAIIERAGLGWSQGLLAGRGFMTLEEAKEINKRWAGG